MAKRILSVCFILVIGFLGLNFLAPSLALVKTADALTIEDLEVDDTGNFENNEGFYTVSFTTTSPFLTGGSDSIEVIFPSSFGFPGNVTVDADDSRLACSPEPGNKKVTCENGTLSQIPSDVPINIFINGVTNPSEDEYDLTIEWKLPPDSSTESVTVQEEPITGGGGGTKCTIRGIPGPADIINCLRQIPSMIGEFLATIIIGALKSLIGFLVAILLIIGAFMVEATAALSDFGSTSAARTGFDVTLGLTNIGFVLAIIIVAFATILRRESYAMQKVLPRLIIIAILINFSWFFATTLINISNELGLVLMTAVGSVGGIPTNISEIGNIGDMFKNAFSRADWSGVFPNIDPYLDAQVEFLLAIFIGLMEVLMQAVFGLVAFFALIATAIMLLLRYLMLTFLLILMPFALLAYIFPGTSGKWTEWFHSFIKWLIIYPVLMFFLAIGFVIADRMLGTPVPNPITMIMNILVVSGIMIGGLVAAQQMGIRGANFVNALTAKTIRRIPANIAGSFRGVGRGARGVSAWRNRGRTGAGGQSGPGGPRAPGGEQGDEPPRTRLNLAGQPEGVPTPGGPGEKYGGVRRDASGNWVRADGSPAEDEGFVDMFGQHGNVENEPEPTEGNRGSLESNLNMPIESQQWRRVEEPEEDKKPGIFKRAGRGIEAWSRGGDTTMDILKAGAKDVAGKEAGIFEGFFKGKTDNLKNAEKKLKEIHEKEFNLKGKITELEDKLERDILQTNPALKMTPKARAEAQGRLAVMKQKHLPDIEKEKPKAQKEVKKFGGDIKRVEKEAGETREIHRVAKEREEESQRQANLRNQGNQGNQP